MVAVLHEVQLADPVDVDRRHLLAPAAGRGDALPAPAHPGRGGAERAVELAVGAVDGAHDRVERDGLHAEVALAAAPERRHDLLEGQHDRHVVGLAAQARGDRGQRAAAALPREDGARVGFGESGVHERLTIAPRRPPGAGDRPCPPPRRRGRRARAGRAGREERAGGRHAGSRDRRRSDRGRAPRSAVGTVSRGTSAQAEVLARSSAVSRAGIQSPCAASRSSTSRAISSSESSAAVWGSSIAAW